MDITDVFGNYVQRDQRNDNAYHNKGYTGHEYDDSTGLTYAHARYLATPTHSFLSSDPVIYNLESNKDEDKKRFNGILNNPQLQNSYAYAGNNPVVNIDKDGRYVEVSFSTVSPGWSYSAGIRMDGNGVDFFMAGGRGYGFSEGIGLLWAPGQSLSHQPGSSMSINGTAGAGIIGQFSQGIYSYSSKAKTSIPNGDPVFGIGLGEGYSASIQQEVSTPIPGLVWGKTVTQSSQDNNSSKSTTLNTKSPSKIDSLKLNPSLSFRNPQPSQSKLKSNLFSRLLGVFKK